MILTVCVKKERKSMKAKYDLYEFDFAEWIEQQIQLLRSKEFEQLDLENILEEMESMGKSDKRVLHSQLIRLLTHLLKFKYQPERQETGTSWLKTIRDARKEINLILLYSPSLKNWLELNFDGIYLRSLRDTSEETGLPISIFDKKCPWSIDEVLGDE